MFYEQAVRPVLALCGQISFYGTVRNGAYESSMSDGRIAPRKRVLKAGIIDLGAGGTIACAVKNLSETGAALDVKTPLFIPDRFKLVIDVIERTPGLAPRAAKVTAAMHAKHAEHRAYITEHGTDMPEISGWAWGRRGAAPTGSSDTAADQG